MLFGNGAQGEESGPAYPIWEGASRQKFIPVEWWFCQVENRYPFPPLTTATMHHGKHFRRLNRTSSHRQALLRNMVSSLIEHGRIETTLAKAKELQPIADRMVTLGKRGDVEAKKQALSYLTVRIMEPLSFNILLKVSFFLFVTFRIATLLCQNFSTSWLLVSPIDLVAIPEFSVSVSVETRMAVTEHPWQ